MLTLATAPMNSRMRFMQANTRLNLSTAWNFDNREASLNTLRDALISPL